ncbi:hypothetical protein D5086_006490 [Populus alba]|uniref:Uncharacterized protein n=5 Tax=Populus TaxID=3689 RepID=A0ACC4CM84_POPAL|nr:hypothetical protein POTOM_011712 [Populus tomentosa]KAJ7003331.1 hypothetical protein NC653_008538 [Populus alba x Populus x berolinensis]
MGKLQLKNVMLLSKRSYGIATENLSKQKAAVSVMRKARDVKSSEDLETGDSKEFWMRDPKTGNWIPESHFGDIDVAEMREKFLSKKDQRF